MEAQPHIPIYTSITQPFAGLGSISDHANVTVYVTITSGQPYLTEKIKARRGIKLSDEFQRRRVFFIQHLYCGKDGIICFELKTVGPSISGSRPVSSMNRVASSTIAG